MAIQVCIVEDNENYRESLAMLISGADGYRCAGKYSSAEQAIRAIPTVKPDVVLMDIELPEKDGIQCVLELKAKLPALPIIMLTAYENTERIFNSLAAGACGYMLKRTPPHELLTAIQEVHAGGSPMSTEIARKVVASFHGKQSASKEVATLTDREAEILSHLAKGYRNKEIADVLKVSMDTVRTHLRHIYDKLHVQSRTEALLKYLQK
jgi:DNA-binding NarL/FixJ family response regulator